MMNDKIRELRKTADDMFHDELLKNNEARWHAYVSLSLEEENRIDEIFAGLIIKECASICDKIEDDYLEINESYTAIGAGVCCTEILNRFGIEE